MALEFFLDELGHEGHLLLHINRCMENEELGTSGTENKTR